MKAIKTQMRGIAKMLLGGGILVCAILSNLNATELSTICTNPNDCKIDKIYSEVAHHGTLALGSYIQLATNGGIDTFINYGTITNTGNTRTFYWVDGYMRHLINHGTMGGIGGNRDKAGGTTLMSVTNYGVMGAIDTSWGTADITINNFGSIGRASNDGKTRHLAGGSYAFIIQNYALMITQNAMTFNAFSGNAVDSSQVVLDGGSMRFFDANAKVILDFGGDFSFGEAYRLDKLFVDMSGKSVLNVDFSRLTVPSDIYYLTQNGDNFIVNLAPQYGIVGTLHKTNVRTMNNFTTMSNAMIYPRKYNFVILRERSDRRISKNISSLRASEYERGNSQNSALDSANSLKSYESFSYRNEAQNRRIQRQNKRNYSRKSLKTQKTQNLKQPQNLNADSANKNNQNNSSLRASEYERGNPNNLLRDSANHDYYFILTPFVNYNSFAQSGNYNLSGFDYGFLTAFSAQVAESNSLGAHFIFSYGSLGDKKDKDLSIKSLNLNLGINYKLDLVYDMYLKARGDFYYFSNALDSLTTKNIKPNNLGFGASVSYGKDFDFKSGGILGIEAGLDYKALQSSTISLHDNIYQKALYHLLYADLGVNYAKYFGNFGLNAGLGIRGNITANKLAKSQIHISNLNRNVDMVLDNDNFLGYANLGVSYVLNARDFDMEFSLAYYGNFGDKAISNAGGFEWRVLW